MNDKTYIGLVDTHAKGVCRYHDAHVVGLPLLLMLVFCGMLQSGMIVGGADAGLAEHAADVGGAASAAYIDNSCPRNRVENMYELGLFVLCTPNDIGKIVAFEAHAEYALLLELQFLLNVDDDVGSGCGSECEDRHVGIEAANVGNMEVGGSEIVAPLADAMGLVDSDEADVHAPKLYLENLRSESFGSDIE